MLSYYVLEDEQKWGIDFNAFLQKHFVLLSPSHKAVLVGEEQGDKDIKASQVIACSRLRDGGGKSFSNKKCEKRGGAGERQGSYFSRRHRPLSQVVRVLFSLCSF